MDDSTDDWVHNEFNYGSWVRKPSMPRWTVLNDWKFSTLATETLAATLRNGLKYDWNYVKLLNYRCSSPQFRFKYWILVQSVMRINYYLRLTPHYMIKLVTDQTQTLVDYHGGIQLAVSDRRRTAKELLLNPTTRLLTLLAAIAPHCTFHTSYQSCRGRHLGQTTNTNYSAREDVNYRPVGRLQRLKLLPPLN